MTDKIQTSKLADLINIFDPKVQESDDVGGARILYTFSDNGESVRERVGKTFILQVLEPDLSFFVQAPIDGNIEEGTIVFSEELEELRDRYRLTKADLTQLIKDISIAKGFDEDMINNLLEE